MTLPISACLIVRDEAAEIAGCVTAITPYVAEVLVADTGSTDDTPKLAAEAGARVVEVAWRDDFAAARNAATEACTHDWILSVDADERPEGDPAAVRTLLGGDLGETAGFGIAFRIEGPNPRGAVPHRAVRLFRRSVARWRGRVHEEVVASDGSPAVIAQLPERALALVHTGYADPAAFARKVTRNLALARAEVAGLANDGTSGERRVAALLDLGRTELAAGLSGEGRATLGLVRDLARPGTPAWVWATDFLAWDDVRHARLDRAWDLLGELSDHGAGEQHVRPLTERLLRD
ncbi:glycosyltransferase [Nocardioides sp. BP30]|uniref:glycosyltransferase n=1 Tax=Nocardioides sp. BP30 TaxID=3036374 RepID=UPI00246932B3|nr:glycosyltransferase [Nocardioides sp. BP30]WGL51037.1 glycosyltransferase [Nocardioides sp. BP30]